MHILHVIKAISTGGASRSLCAIARYLKRLGPYRHSVISLLPAEHGPLELALRTGIEVYESPDSGTIRRLVEQADIVHVEWWNSPMLYEFLRSDLPPARMLLLFHVAGDTIPNVVTAPLVEFGDFCVGCCPYTSERAPLLNLPADVRESKTATVLATSDFDRLAGLQPQAHDGFNAGYIGMVDFRKMHSAFVRMSAAVRVPGIKFIVCGDGHLDVLRTQVAAAGAVDRFEFRGFVPDIRPVLAILDVYGYPLAEKPGSELNVQEVMYAGIPPVVFPLGGLRDLVTNGHTGLVVHSETEYSQAIEYLYREPEVRAQLARNAAAYARAWFGGERSAREIDAIYQRMMALPKRHRSWRAVPLADAPSGRGALLWIDSLDHEDSLFRTSLAATDRNDVLAAEEQIAALDFRAVWGIEEYVKAYPGDAHLALWLGLTRRHAGRTTEACEAFEQAVQNGLPKWRVELYRSKALAE